MERKIQERPSDRRAECYPSNVQVPFKARVLVGTHLSGNFEHFLDQGKGMWFQKS